MSGTRALRDEPRDLGPGDAVGDYQITTRLGVGGMGTVYAARHPLIGKEVALKVVNREFVDDHEVRARFLTEARALTQIDHKNVVDVYSFGELADGRVYLLMELIHGRSLGEIIDRDRLDLFEILSVLDQIASALAACHEARIIHRDLKPENVFVFGRGHDITVKLIDFGIAKIAGLQMSEELTGEGVVLGTPAYMAPEQVRGLTVDERCDLYSLGVLAYELLSGELPFHGPTCADTLASVLTGVAKPLRKLIGGCPRDLEALVSDLMRKDRVRRPTVDEIRARLAEIRDHLETPPPRSEPVEEPPATQTEIALEPDRRWRVAPIGLLVVGVAFAGLALRGHAVPLSLSVPHAAAAIDQAPVEPPEEPLVEEAIGAIARPEVTITARPAPVRRRSRPARRPRVEVRHALLANPDALLDPFTEAAR